MSHRDNEVRLAKDVWGSVERDAAPELRKGAKSPFQIISDSDGDEGGEVSVNSYRAMETRKTFLGCGGPHLNCIYCAFTAPQSLEEREDI